MRIALDANCMGYCGEVATSVVVSGAVWRGLYRTSTAKVRLGCCPVSRRRMLSASRRALDPGQLMLLAEIVLKSFMRMLKLML